jgi:hypothetical protein
MSSDDNDDDAKQASTNKRKIESIDAETTHKKKTKKVKSKKSSVMDLVRKNQSGTSTVSRFESFASRSFTLTVSSLN